MAELEDVAREFRETAHDVDEADTNVPGGRLPGDVAELEAEIVADAGSSPRRL